MKKEMKKEIFIVKKGNEVLNNYYKNVNEAKIAVEKDAAYFEFTPVEIKIDPEGDVLIKAEEIEWKVCADGSYVTYFIDAPLDKLKHPMLVDEIEYWIIKLEAG